MNPLCVEEGVGLIPWSPLARGLLARPKPEDAEVVSDATERSRSDDYSPKLYDDASWAIVDAVEAVAEARGVQMAEVALAWLLSRPGVVAPVVGATKLDHLDAAVRALELELAQDELERLEAPYQPRGVRGYT